MRRRPPCPGMASTYDAGRYGQLHDSQFDCGGRWLATAPGPWADSAGAPACCCFAQGVRVRIGSWPRSSDTVGYSACVDGAAMLRLQEVEFEVVRLWSPFSRDVVAELRGWGWGARWARLGATLLAESWAGQAIVPLSSRWPGHRPGRRAELKPWQNTFLEVR